MALATFSKSAVRGIVTAVPRTERCIDDEADLYGGHARQIAMIKKTIGLDRRRVVERGTTSADLCEAAAARSHAVELAPQGVRVNTVAPGMVRTPMTTSTAGQLAKGALERDEELYPLGYGEPEDVANAVIYLLAPELRWVTGSTLVVDGGFTAQ